jgi:Ca2+-binding EF-hand superfamily protein
VLTALMTAGVVLAGKSLAQTTAKVDTTANIGAIAEANVKQLLLLMDTDKNGKISKAEWMRFMSAEFDRLDTDKSGELDPKELMESRVSVHYLAPEVQGK